MWNLYFWSRGAQLEMLRSYSWFCNQELLLAMTWGLCGMLGIKRWLAMDKARSYPLYYLFSPRHGNFYKRISLKFSVVTKK